jgi:exonuclease SbcD
MKFLHTADWHLGRLFHQVHLTGDQSHALDQIVRIAEEERVDVVIVAGDLYDRAVPPPEAVALLDRIWQRLTLELGIPVVAIPGNHDSATRIGYGAALLARAGLHLRADFESATRPIAIGGVDLFALPFAEPSEVRAWSSDPEVRDHASAMRACIGRMRPHFQAGRPRLLVAHAFVAGMHSSESERPLSVGGAGTVPADAFVDFDYVALGHLHAPQRVSDLCVYSGSPLKYSFSESDDIKSVLVGEITDTGVVSPPRAIPIQPLRNVRSVEGSLALLLETGRTDPGRDDYLRVILTDDGALLNALGRLREIYPNVLQLERRFLQSNPDNPTVGSPRRRESTETELFSGFFREVLGVEPGTDELLVFQEVVAELRRAESETPEGTK